MKYFDFLDNEEENVIKRAIDLESGNVLHGILVCNIDNFIIVNEMFGRSTGDKILNQVQDVMSKLFRGNDIIVKLRGDEFVVFNKNIHELNNVELLATKLLNAISSICVNDSFNLTASVGIAIYPFHGATYVELKNKAYQAMYRAKANGKNGFRLYDSARTKSVYHDFIYNNKSFSESDKDDFFEFKGDKSYQDICIEMFREDRDALSAMTSIMEISCIYLGFSRCYAYTKLIDKEEELKKLRYANSGYEFGKESKALKLLKEDMICRLAEKYTSLSLINADNESVDEEIINYMDVMGIFQILYYPIFKGEDFAGAIVFENLTDDYVSFEHEELETLDQQMKSIQAYFYHSYDKRNFNENLTKLELFENVDACIYIIDAESGNIEFANRKAQLVDNINRIGQKYYEVFSNKDEPPKDCPLCSMDPDDPRSNGSETAFNFAIGKWCRNLYSWLDVTENRGKAIMISIDIDDLFGNTNM